MCSLQKSQQMKLQMSINIFKEVYSRLLLTRWHTVQSEDSSINSRHDISFFILRSEIKIVLTFEWQLNRLQISGLNISNCHYHSQTV
jgi:hypothetical protein